MQSKNKRWGMLDATNKSHRECKDTLWDDTEVSLFNLGVAWLQTFPTSDLVNESFVLMEFVFACRYKSEYMFNTPKIIEVL